MDIVKKDETALAVSNDMMRTFFETRNPTASDMLMLREAVMADNRLETHTGNDPVHLFCNGMYTRILEIPAGDLI